MSDFLLLIINVYVFFVLLEETKTEMRSVLISSSCLYLYRTWHAAFLIFGAEVLSSACKSSNDRLRTLHLFPRKGLEMSR